MTQRAWMSWSSGKDSTLACVDPRQLDGDFAGRAFGLDLLADLPAGVDPCGENGEFHTFVHDGPGFAAPLRSGSARWSSATASCSPTSCRVPRPIPWRRAR